jgi:2'-5' RNA ligase
MSLRLFAAIAIPDDVAARLMALMRGVPGAAWRPRENLHLTLRFFGQVAEPDADGLDAALEAAGRAVEPFDLRLKGAGYFGKDEPSALWIGAAESEPLKRLASACNRAARSAGVPPDPQTFTPHVTVAYLRATPVERAMAFTQRCALFEAEPFRVEGFGLYSSRVRKNAPSSYREEGYYPLGA